MRQRDEPLTSEDLTVCDEVLQRITEKHAINDHNTTVHLASIIIEIYRQGVDDTEQLALLAGASCEAMLEMRQLGPSSDPAPLHRAANIRGLESDRMEAADNQIPGKCRADI
ncbi:hypothetical protein [Rhizobium sp. BK068]|uniref:hypothetical protein n=1 Tax=Rhizobium sp. BK068 TaxID=2512130 RepID=UPI0010EB2D65|nr:hypothetical protein [Rhizobium sp. BK068]TCM80700.1 hypothetical protein EV291_102153 [Rhizobium sp. BK068]